LREIHAADSLSVADGGEKEEMRSVSSVFSSSFVVVGGGESLSSSSSKRVFYDPFRGRRRRLPKAVSLNNNNDNDNDNNSGGRQQTKFSFENENKSKLNGELLVKETALRAEEARAKSLLQKVKRLKETKDKKIEEEQREYEETKEMTENEQRRNVNKEKMKLVGGRDPANRPPGPIWASAVVCAVAAVGFYYLTINTSDGIVEYVKDAFGNLGPTYAKSGLVSLTVGTGVVLSSVFAFSAIILVLIGAQETKRLISNEPVVYFRCCGCDEKCCQNGPHNKGYSTRFIYRNDGRGYETRSAERMRAHLRVSKNCTPLEPLIVYPREAKWGWWGPNDLVRYQNEMLRMKEQKQGKFR
tara:strand:- start:9582 stop:10649 length:1068 start_codon:yes stop_codon:yes gene_type:complete